MKKENDKMNPVVHFEMPYEDRDRAAKFYGEVFGWQAQKYGPDMGDYMVVRTTEVDEKTLFPKEPGRINGGFYKKTADPLTHKPNLVISVDDVDAKLKEIEAAGGKRSGEPTDIPSVGRYANFIDPEGNRASIIKPLPM